MINSRVVGDILSENVYFNSCIFVHKSLPSILQESLMSIILLLFQQKVDHPVEIYIVIQGTWIHRDLSIHI